MFSFFKKKAPPPTEPSTAAAPAPETPASSGLAWLRKPFGGAAAESEAPAPATPPASAAPDIPAVAEPTPKPEGERQGWMARLKSGLRKTGSSIAT
ncbi:MAG: signal recognition particle-docking protein FtsY, partial [Proteobacteria bacterium]|nr:signal recognition particle-docking protein FtsY [Pseudomonadota bacterium]